MNTKVGIWTIFIHKIAMLTEYINLQFYNGAEVLKAKVGFP